MTVYIHKIHVGDTLTPLRVAIKALNSSGVYAAVDLTGKSVYFRMEDEQENAVTAAGTGTTNDCTVTDATAGEVEYDFSSTDVDASGLFYGYFEVYSGDERDTYPVEEKELQILIT